MRITGVELVGIGTTIPSIDFTSWVLVPTQIKIQDSEDGDHAQISLRC